MVPRFARAAGALAVLCGCAAIALGAGSGWVAQSPVTPSGGAELDGVACAAADDCFAVGVATVGSGHTFAERWNGSKWSVSKTPSVGGDSALRGVDCASKSFCMAVGSVFKGGAHGRPVAIRWDGSRWTRVAVPVPRNLSAKFPITAFEGISCVSASDCTVVGEYDGPTDYDRPLVERWNGRRLRLQPAPDSGRYLNRFEAVDCPAANSCLAVGQGYTSPLGRYSHTMAESWNGKRWRLEHPPTVPGHTQAELAAVSCTAARDCEVVGGARYKPLALRWTGRWRKQAMPPIARFSQPELTGVFCATASSCVAVGFLYGTAGDAYAEHFDGRRWTSEQLPKSSRLGRLGLGCVDIATCEAVAGQFDRDPFSRHAKTSAGAWGEAAATPATR